MKKYRKGQKVKISRNSIRPGDSPEFASDMNQWKGKVVTVDCTKDIDNDKYFIKEDGGRWIWAGRWFEAVDEDQGEVVEIKNDTAFLYQVYKEKGEVKRDKEKEVKVTDLIHQIISSKGIATPILPVGVKYYQRNGNHETVVFEEAPKVRRVRISLDRERGPFMLAFPYTVMVIKFSNGKINGNMQFYYRNAPIQNLEAELYYSNLTNIDSDGVCMGYGFKDEVTLAEKISKLVQRFWASSFNDDITSYYRKAQEIDGRIASLKKWQKSSQDDSLFMLQIPWKKCAYLNEIVHKVNNSCEITDCSGIADLMYQK